MRTLIRLAALVISCEIAYRLHETWTQVSSAIQQILR
jgi:hypothetical protein